MRLRGLKLYSIWKGWLLLGLLLLAGNLRAGSGFDTSSPVNYFTSVANKFLTARPEFAQAGLSITNIPVYPVNYYTPSVHRLLQLAANIYDASTNKTSAPPYDFDYPSVFRPVFAIAVEASVTNILIEGYVEVTTNADYNYPAYSLTVPSDVATIISNLIASNNNFNVYGIPWVIGAKKGFPNFNQISLESFTALTRKLQIVKPSLSANRTTWQTNVQYVLGISNAVEVEAWNSYQSNYGRAVDIGGIDEVTLVLTNEFGELLSTNVAFDVGGGGGGIFVTNWPGTPVNLTKSALSNSFIYPIFTAVTPLPPAIYSTNAPGSFIVVPDPLTASFATTTGYPLPQFGLNVTNRLRFVMVDAASGRVIDYVQLDGMIGQRNLTSAGELQGNDDWGPGGVWDTNRIPFNSSNPNSPFLGILNQVEVSLFFPPYYSGYSTPVTQIDWNSSQIQQEGFASITAAVDSFNAFYNKNTNLNDFLAMQVPFTPTRSVCVYYTWQANDPLIHYTLPDLTDMIYLGYSPQTNWFVTNLIFGNLGQLNRNYNPWGGISLNGGNYLYNTNPAFIDPLVSSSDDWDFPAGSLDFSTIGSVHRGTPWQTVYLKSACVDPTLWQNWTGDGAVFPSLQGTSDSVISQPTNDWRLMALLDPLLNPTDPRQLFSVNQPDFAAILDGLDVVTNATPPSFLVMYSNSPQAAIIANAVNSLRAAQPGGIFTNLGDVLAVLELSLNSPWLDFSGDGSPLSDSDYELIPSQLLALLRTDSIGSVTLSNGALQIQFTGMDGYAYEVEASTNLQGWVPLATQCPTNGVFIFTDPAGTSLGNRFYRTSLLPNP
jgi:hypothetical protein